MVPDDLNRPDVTAFLQQPLYACVSTVSRDGLPHLTYVWYKWDGQHFVISMAKNRVKYRNLLERPAAGIAILDPTNPYRYVSASGKAVMTEENVEDFAVEAAVHYMGEVNGPALGRSLAQQPATICQIKPEKVIVNGF